MDNRIDVTEDFQSTPEHPGSRRPAPATQQAADSQLTAGPHNDPPRSTGFDHRSQPPSGAGGGPADEARNDSSYESSDHSRNQRASAWRSLRRTFSRHPLPVALSLAGVGVTLDLLARRRRH